MSLAQKVGAVLEVVPHEPLVGAQEGEQRAHLLRGLLEPVASLVQGSGFQGQGSRVQGSGFRVQGSGFGVQGSGFRVQGSGFRV